MPLVSSSYANALRLGMLARHQNTRRHGRPSHQRHPANSYTNQIMSDPDFLNRYRVCTGQLGSDDDGFKGFFCVRIKGARVKCMASDGEGWQHVSVSVDKSNQPPSWALMCAVKDLFWQPEDCVIQFHPPAAVYVNQHPGVLHLWRSLHTAQPMPPLWMV